MTGLVGLLRRPAVGMAVGTAASRATGLGRTVALAAALGVGTLSDAYNIANTAPNMLFTLVAGGVLTSALVPMLARGEHGEARRETASVVFGTVTAWSVAVAALMAIGAPALMRMLAAGSSGDARKDLLDLGTQWMRIFAPQVVLYAVSVTATGIMAADRKLALGAAAPVVTNLVTIAAAVAFVAAAGSRPPADGVDGAAIAALGWGTTIAVAAMAVIQLLGARATQPGLRFQPRLRHPAVTELRRLGGWMTLYVLVNQVALAAVIGMATTVRGGVTAYQWAFVLMQLPYAIIAVSIFSSAYPSLARRSARREPLTPLVREASNRALVLLLPAAGGLAVVATPLAAAVVGPGEAALVAAALRGFAVSLVPFSLFQLLTRTSYATGDTKTPALVNIAVNAVMLAVDAAVLATSERAATIVLGLAAGHAASYVVGCGFLLTLLRRRRVLDALLPQTWPRVTAVAAGMTAILWALPLPNLGSRGAAFFTTVAVGAVGALLYSGGVLAVGIDIRRLIAPATER